MAVATRPVLNFAVHEDGTLEVLSLWFPLVEFSDEVLALADGYRLILRGDELTIRCANGEATYALGRRDEHTASRAGRLLRAWRK